MRTARFNGHLYWGCVQGCVSRGSTDPGPRGRHPTGSRVKHPPPKPEANTPPVNRMTNRRLKTLPCPKRRLRVVTRYSVERPRKSPVDVSFQAGHGHCSPTPPRSDNGTIQIFV